MELVNNMVETLKTSMPSEDLTNLIHELQRVTTDHMKLNEEFAQKENDLTQLENQLMQLEGHDTNLSEAVIQLRKDI